MKYTNQQLFYSVTRHDRDELFISREHDLLRYVVKDWGQKAGDIELHNPGEADADDFKDSINFGSVTWVKA